MCLAAPAAKTSGKLDALAAKGQAAEGLVTLTHDNINIAQCTHNVVDDNILWAVDPTLAYHVTRLVNNVPISFMVDTGASVRLIHEDIWEKSSDSSAGGLETWNRQLVGVGR